MTGKSKNGKGKKKNSQSGKKKKEKSPQQGTIVAFNRGNAKKSVLPNQDKRVSSSGEHPHAIFHHAVCSQTDPFCTHALGARIPDGNAGRSIAFQARGSTIITTDAGGYGGLVILPTLPQNLIPVLSRSGSTITWNGTMLPTLPGFGLFAGDFNQYRIVSFGVKLSSILNATNNSGYMVVGSQSSVVSTTIVPDMEMDDSMMIPLNNFKGATWISKRLPNYNVYGGSLGASFGFPISLTNYTACNIQVFGPVSQQAVLCELVCNFEFTPQTDTVGAALAAKPPVKNDAVLTGASHVQANTRGTFMKDVDEVGDVIEKFVAKTPLGMIANIGASLLKAL